MNLARRNFLHLAANAAVLTGMPPGIGSERYRHKGACFECQNRDRHRFGF